jgi:hypothetical protein
VRRESLQIAVAGLLASALTGVLGIEWTEGGTVTIALLRAPRTPGDCMHRYDAWIAMRDGTRRHFEWTFRGDDDIFPESYTAAWRSAALEGRARQANVYDERRWGFPVPFLQVFECRYGRFGLYDDVPNLDLYAYQRFQFGRVLLGHALCNAAVWATLWILCRLAYVRLLGIYRWRRDLCTKCGYDVGNTPTGACPECGNPNK